MDILKLLNNDTSELSQEEKFYADRFNEKLREKLIDELAIYEGNNLIELINKNETVFKEKIQNIFINGIRAYKNLPTKTLIDIYIEKCGEIKFINLIEKVSIL